MSAQYHAKSIFGKSMLPFTVGYQGDGDSAQSILAYALTHGHKNPSYHAIESLAPMDRAIYLTVMDAPPMFMVRPDDARQPAAGMHTVFAYVSSLGRLHLRQADAQYERNSEALQYFPMGRILLDEALFQSALRRHADWQGEEEKALAVMRRAMARLDGPEARIEVLRNVIDHVQHVESVCFYVGDDCYTKIDRSETLVTSKAGIGYLNSLCDVPPDQWDDKACMVVMSLRALFLSGKSVRCEELNGLALTASLVLGILQRLHSMYRAAGVPPTASLSDGLLEAAQAIRVMSLEVRPPWFRYRWIYALTFFKTERLIEAPATAADDVLEDEFADIHSALAGGRMSRGDEIRMFAALGAAALRRGSRGLDAMDGRGAATDWFEFLIQSVVASAVRATASDYGMSSSLRDIAPLVRQDYERASEHVNGLSTRDFYTCFVSTGFARHLSPETAHLIASTVQKRMMFNRWHFIPANLVESDIDSGRHWYYQPAIPDIAEHSDVHREAHARAAVKYSIRSPGPDMSRPPLVMGALQCRGFYDVRVVRMAGRPYDVHDMLRARRRTLWLEGLFKALVEFLGTPGTSHRIEGFNPGDYLDEDPVVPQLAPADVED